MVQHVNLIETKNNKKLMGEYEKFHELQVKSEKMQEDYDKQLQEVHSSKEQSLHELTEYYETKLREKSFLVEQVSERFSYFIFPVRSKISVSVLKFVFELFLISVSVFFFFLFPTYNVFY